MKLNNLLKLRSEADRVKSEIEQAKGAMAALKDKLKKDFGCKDIKEAKKILSELEETLIKEERELENLISEYEALYVKE